MTIMSISVCVCVFVVSLRLLLALALSSCLLLVVLYGSFVKYHILSFFFKLNQLEIRLNKKQYKKKMH